jgi:hypothetical protein
MSELLQHIASVDSSSVIAAGKNFIQERFGTPGLVATLILTVSIGALLASKILKIAFDVLRFVVVPSVVVTFIATYFLPFSFIYILPATVALFSVVLIIKG